MHDGRAPTCAGQAAGSQAISRSISAMFSVCRCAVLLRPALDLAGDISFGLAEIAKPARGGIDGMQSCDGLVERGEEEGALFGSEARRPRLPEDPARHMLHDEEFGADDAFIGAIDAAAEPPEDPAPRAPK